MFVSYGGGTGRETVRPWCTRIHTRDGTILGQDGGEMVRLTDVETGESIGREAV